MPQAGRSGDMHVCPQVTPGTPPVPHVGGPVAQGCPTVMIGYMPAARVGDVATCVGPPDPIAMGSATVMIGYMPAARVGDLTTHGGTIAMGCPTVMIGDFGAGGAGAGVAAGMEAGGAVAQVIAAFASGVPAQVGPVPESQVGPLQPKKEEKKKTWIGIQLKSFDGSPMPDQDFQVTLDGGQVLSGRTDEKGYARFENIDPDQGQVVFTRILQSQDRKRKEAAKEDPSQQRPAGPHFPEAEQSQSPMKGKEEEKSV
jgi:uncharacterized Zn-binding protein involved in type VI secretion